MIVTAYNGDTNMWNSFYLYKGNKSDAFLEEKDILMDADKNDKAWAKAKSMFTEEGRKPVGVVVFQGGVATFLEDGTYMMMVYAFGHPQHGKFKPI